MLRINQIKTELEVSLTRNLKIEKQHLQDDERDQRSINTEKVYQFGQARSINTNLNEEEVLINRHLIQIQSLKQKYSSGVQKYKLVLKNIIDCANSHNKKGQDNTEFQLIQNLQQKSEFNQKLQNSTISHENKNITSTNNSDSISQNDEEWVQQLKDQLEIQMQNLVAIHESILSEVDNRFRNRMKRDNLTEEQSQNQDQNFEGDLESDNTKSEFVKDFMQIKGENTIDKDIIQIFEANTFVEDSEEDELSGYFGQKYKGRTNVNTVSFLGEMREVLQEKQKKPTIHEKIDLDTEEEKINYEKSKINMKDMVKERRVFQSTNQASLLSELKFVIKK